MWIDANGDLHTVALPEPSDLMSVEFAAALTALAQRRRYRRRLFKEIDKAEMAIASEAVDHPVSRFESLRGRVPGEELLSSAVKTVPEVVQELESVALEWRLDAVMAVYDFLDAIASRGAGAS